MASNLCRTQTTDTTHCLLTPTGAHTSRPCAAETIPCPLAKPSLQVDAASCPFAVHTTESTSPRGLGLSCSDAAVDSCQRQHSRSTLVTRDRSCTAATGLAALVATVAGECACLPLQLLLVVSCSMRHEVLKAGAPLLTPAWPTAAAHDAGTQLLPTARLLAARNERPLPGTPTCARWTHNRPDIVLGYSISAMPRSANPACLQHAPCVHATDRCA